MKKEPGQAVEGTVTDDLPNDLYKVELDNGSTVVAHVGPQMRLKFTRIRPGERVRVELSTYDHSRGRIVNRYK